jgi:hypothetical protein
MYNLTSENDGKTYFKCTLQLNEDNLSMNSYEFRGEERRLKSDDPFSFGWQVLRPETLKEISFAFKFKNP